MPVRPPLVLIPQFFGCLVFDRRSSRYLPFDEAATAFLLQLVEEPIHRLLAEESDPTRRDATRAFFESFERRGFFTLDGRLAADVLPIEPPTDHLAGPLAVHLEVIGACNLSCTHCFASPLPRNDDPLSLAEIDALLADLAAVGSFRLGLTGGEPLGRKDLFEIVDAATGHGLHPCLTTNGLLIDDEIAREFGRRELVWLNVSLDGASAETNDAIRGPGVFDTVVDRLRVLGRHARFTLAFTITSRNVHEVEDCARLAHDLGAHTAVFRPVYPAGSARDQLDLMPTFAEYTDALRRIADVVEPEGDVRGIDPFSPQSREASQAKVFSNPGCGAANLVASVSVQGDVNPCSFLGTSYDAGNVRRASFAEIWHASEAFTAMRNLSSGDGGGGFDGGCRARSLVLAGDVDAPDPWQQEHAATACHSAGSSSIPPTYNLEVYGE